MKGSNELQHLGAKSKHREKIEISTSQKAEKLFDISVAESDVIQELYALNGASATLPWTWEKGWADETPKTVEEEELDRMKKVAKGRLAAILKQLEGSRSSI